MKKYRQSSNIIDKRKADFSERTMSSYSARAKSGQPNPLTFKEPMEYQHDDRTDDAVIKARGPFDSKAIARQMGKPKTADKLDKMSSYMKKFPKTSSTFIEKAQAEVSKAKKFKFFEPKKVK